MEGSGMEWKVRETESQNKNKGLREQKGTPKEIKIKKNYRDKIS